MNLLEHHIIEIVSKEDQTCKFESYMRKKDPTFVAKEKYYDVELVVNCYGNVSTMYRFWSESQLKEAVENGYFMA